MCAYTYIMDNGKAEMDRRRWAIDQARASVRLSGTILPPEIEALNKRFIDGEIDGDEHIRLVFEFAESIKRAKAVQEQPFFLDPLYDPLIHALNDFADNNGSKLLELLRDSPFRNEYRAYALAAPAEEPTWQIPHCAPAEPVRCMREVHEIIHVIKVKEAAEAALREINDQS